MGNIIPVNFSGTNRGRTDKPVKETLPKYKFGVTLRHKNTGEKVVGVVITSFDLFDWAEANDYAIIAGFCFNTPPTVGLKTSLSVVDESPVIDPEPSAA